MVPKENLPPAYRALSDRLEERLDGVRHIRSPEGSVLLGVRVGSQKTPAPHAVHVTLGLTELLEKESVDRDVSGWGHELVLRTAGADPSNFACNLLEFLAAYEWEAGVPFTPESRIALGGFPIPPDYAGFAGATFEVDAQLGSFEGPNGKVTFLEVILLRPDEFDALRDWSSAGTLAVLREAGGPLAFASLDRPSYLKNPEVAAAIALGKGRDGSSCDATLAHDLVSVRKGWFSKETSIHLDALLVPEVAALLEARIPFGRAYTILGSKWRVDFVPSPAVGWKRDGAVVTVDVTAEAARAWKRDLLEGKAVAMAPLLNLRPV